MTTYAIQTRMKGTACAEWDRWTHLPGCRRLDIHAAVCIAAGEISGWQHSAAKEEVRIVERDNGKLSIWAHWSTEHYGNLS